MGNLMLPIHGSFWLRQEDWFFEGYDMASRHWIQRPATWRGTCMEWRCPCEENHVFLRGHGFEEFTAVWNTIDFNQVGIIIRGRWKSTTSKLKSHQTFFWHEPASDYLTRMLTVHPNFLGCLGFDLCLNMFGHYPCVFVWNWGAPESYGSSPCFLKHGIFGVPSNQMWQLEIHKWNFCWGNDQWWISHCHALSSATCTSPGRPGDHQKPSQEISQSWWRCNPHISRTTFQSWQVWKPNFVICMFDTDTKNHLSSWTVTVAHVVQHLKLIVLLSGKPWGEPILTQDTEECPAECVYDILLPSITALRGGGGFKDRKPIGEFGCCETWMAGRAHWWIKKVVGVSGYAYVHLFISLFI